MKTSTKAEKLPVYADATESAFAIPLMDKGYAWQEATVPPANRRRGVYKVVGGLLALILFLAALAVDPQPIYDKATDLLASGDEMNDANLPSLAELATDSTPQADVTVEGSKWAKDVHYAINPICHHNQTRTFYDAKKKTALATFPRSGNSYIRELLERSTGHLTTSVYCDGVLRETFVGECDHQNQFFQKTHWPALGGYHDGDPVDPTIAQVVSIIRNPLDCLLSFFSYLNSISDGHAVDRHEAHVQGIVGEDPNHQAQMSRLVARWVRFYTFWNTHPIPQMRLRYEDLRNQPLGLMMNLIGFLLPEEDRPDIDQIVCALELQETTEAYHSAKRSHFASWHQYTPEMRQYIVQSTASIWCQSGYDALLEEVHGKAAVDELGVDCMTVRSTPAEA
jgi:hypothetical protein